MRCVYFIFLASISLSAVAGGDYCFEDAAKKNGINKDILIAIAMVESHLDKNAVSKNRNGTEDVGLMQINSVHFPMLQAAGIKRRDLFNACVNIHVSALILKDCIRIHGNTWEAVGAYNVGHVKSPQANRLRRVYAQKVWRKYVRITGVV